MPVNIPSFQPLRLIDVPDTGQELARLMQGTNNMMRTIASARAAQQRAAAAAARASGQVETLSDGTKINVIGSTAKEKDASRKRILASLVEQRLLGNEKYKAYSDAIANASVERQGELLNDFMKTDAVNFAKDQPVEIQAAMQEYLDNALKAYGKRVENVERAAGHAAGDVLSARTGQIAENLSSLGADTAQEMLESGARRDKLMRDVEENNAYIRNQMLREQEGAGFWERNFGGTGSAWTNIKRMAAENAPDFGADIAGPLAGAAAGAAIGSVVPVVGTAAGATIGGILGTIGSGVLGAAEERGEYLSRAATRPDLTEQQRLEAVSGAAPWTAFAGGAALSMLPGDTVMRPVGRAVRRAIGREATDAAQRGFWRQVGRDVAITGAEGAASMAAENTLQNALLSGSTGADIPLTENLMDAMLGGAAIGMPLGVPRGVVNWKRNRPAATTRNQPNTIQTEQPRTPDDSTGTSVGAFADAQEQGRSSTQQTRQTRQNTAQTQTQQSAQADPDLMRFRSLIDDVANLPKKGRPEAARARVDQFMAEAGTREELDRIYNGLKVKGKDAKKDPFFAYNNYTADTLRAAIDEWKLANPEQPVAQTQTTQTPVTPPQTPVQPAAATPDAQTKLRDDLASLLGSITNDPAQTNAVRDRIREYLIQGGDLNDVDVLADSLPDTNAQAYVKAQVAEGRQARKMTQYMLHIYYVEGAPGNIQNLSDEAVKARINDMNAVAQRNWLPDLASQAVGVAKLYSDELVRRQNAQRQTGRTTGQQGGPVTPVVQPVDQGTAGTDGGNPPTDSRVAANPSTDSAIAPEGSAPEVAGDSRAVEGAGTGGTPVQSIRQIEGSEVDAEQTGTGRTDGTPNDDGGDNRLAPTAGTPEDTSAGESSDQGVGDGSTDRDAETLSQRDLPDGESGVVPQNSEAPTSDSFKAVDADSVTLDTPPVDGGNPYAARRDLFDNLQLYGKDAVRIPYILHKVLSPKERVRNLESDIDKLETLLIREAISKTDRYSGFTNRDRAKLEELRAKGISFADPLPPVPSNVIDTARKFRAGDPSVDIEGLVKAGLNPDESLSNTVLNYLCIR